MGERSGEGGALLVLPSAPVQPVPAPTGVRPYTRCHPAREVRKRPLDNYYRDMFAMFANADQAQQFNPMAELVESGRREIYTIEAER